MTKYLCLALFLCVCAMLNACAAETYSTAKEATEEFLIQNREEMEKIAVSLSDDEIENSGHYKDLSYFYDEKNDCTEFEIDAQGMLGGQYWGLIYTKDGCYCGQSETYLYEEPEGNNIRRAEKLDGRWWFIWEDYDGNALSFK